MTPVFRHKDVSWSLAPSVDNCLTWEQVTVAVLMDIRDELKRLNLRVNCPETLAIPRTLREIARNTKKPKRRRVKK